LQLPCARDARTLTFARPAPPPLPTHPTADTLGYEDDGEDRFSDGSYDEEEEEGGGKKGGAGAGGGTAAAPAPAPAAPRVVHQVVARDTVPNLSADGGGASARLGGRAAAGAFRVPPLSVAPPPPSFPIRACAPVAHPADAPPPPPPLAPPPPPSQPPAKRKRRTWTSC
jgi:hypothetical protein